MKCWSWDQSHHRGGLTRVFGVIDWERIAGEIFSSPVLSCHEASQLKLTPSHLQISVSKLLRAPLSLVQIPPDAVFWLVEPYYACNKLYAITTHLKASKIGHFVPLWVHHFAMLGLECWPMLRRMIIILFKLPSWRYLLSSLTGGVSPPWYLPLYFR